MAFLMLTQDFLGTLVFYCNKFFYFLIDEFGRMLTVWSIELILLIVVIAEVWQRFAHTCVSNHAVGTLCDGFEVIHCTR